MIKYSLAYSVQILVMEGVREKEHEIKMKMGIVVTPEFYDIFKKSKTISDKSLIFC